MNKDELIAYFKKSINEKTKLNYKYINDNTYSINLFTEKGWFGVFHCDENSLIRYQDNPLFSTLGFSEKITTEESYDLYLSIKEKADI